MTTEPMKCGVCGGARFVSKRALWDGLVAEWQLAPAEAAYIDRQQGEVCGQCGSNLRSIALANAVRAFLQTELPLREALAPPSNPSLNLLELNEAGGLTPLFRRLNGYVFGAYPAVDMHALPYANGAFDVVVHSDTLEHVLHPIHALTECRRVLKPGGALCFTVPMVVGRMTRGRAGLPKSYHGTVGSRPEDYLVHTEFGADAWTFLMEAGFTNVSMHALAYPAAVAFQAQNGWRAR